MLQPTSQLFFSPRKQKISLLHFLFFTFKKRSHINKYDRISTYNRNLPVLHLIFNKNRQMALHISVNYILYLFFFQGEESYFDEETAFQCLLCAAGCESCVDSSPCIVTLNWVLRTILLILQCVIIGCLPVVVLFTYKYKDIKVCIRFPLDLEFQICHFPIGHKTCSNWPKLV